MPSLPPIAKSMLCTFQIAETASVGITVEAVKTQVEAPSVGWAFFSLMDGPLKPTVIGGDTFPLTHRLMISPLGISQTRIAFKGFSVVGKGDGPSYSGVLQISLYLWANKYTDHIRLSIDRAVDVKFCFGDDLSKLVAMSTSWQPFLWPT